MSSTVALFLSRLAHPLVLVVVFVVYSNFKLQPEEPAVIASVGMIGIGVIPLIIWNLVKLKQGVYTNFDVSERKHRFSMFAFIFILAIALVIFQQVTQQPPDVQLGTLLMIQLIGLSFLLNFWLKSSLHVGVGAFLALAILPLSGAFSVILGILVPFLAWARVSLGRHTWPEVLAGLSVGTASGFQFLFLGGHL